MTTTPFALLMHNDLNRCHLVMNVIDRVLGLGERAAVLRQETGDEGAPGTGTGTGTLDRRGYARLHRVALASPLTCPLLRTAGQA